MGYTSKRVFIPSTEDSPREIFAIESDVPARVSFTVSSDQISLRVFPEGSNREDGLLVNYLHPLKLDFTASSQRIYVQREEGDSGGGYVYISSGAEGGLT